MQSGKPNLAGRDRKNSAPSRFTARVYRVAFRLFSTTIRAADVCDDLSRFPKKSSWRSWNSTRSATRRYASTRRKRVFWWRRRRLCRAGCGREKSGFSAKNRRAQKPQRWGTFLANFKTSKIENIHMHICIFQINLFQFLAFRNLDICPSDI